MPERLSRRRFVTELSAAAPFALAATALSAQPDAPKSGLATGVRAGEITATTARIWARLTRSATRAEGNGQYEKADKNARKSQQPLPDRDVDLLQGACPPVDGRLRVRYSRNAELGDAVVTEWADVTVANDSIHQFQLRNLEPAADYFYSVEGTGPNDRSAAVTLGGHFRTAPLESAAVPVRFCVMTCQGYHDRGHADGHAIYPAMQALKPDFAVLTGDLVYYDNDAPSALSARIARYHWERMFSLPRLVEFNRSVGTYWLKDDHDTLKNDSWRGQAAGQLTFKTGQEIFRQQAPLSDGPVYRTIRWGRELQVWFTDGRDHRSPNSMPDGPEKTIWGDEQKAWFKQTVADSTARWKVLVSPTPLVGPDRPKKNDNHANEGFQHEGDELRAWLKAHVPHNFFVICGDRHWQYHSVHPQSGLHEFSAGPASDEHAGGTPGEDPEYHRFHRVQGGFLSVTVTPAEGAASIRFRHHDVNGAVVYEFAPGQ